MFEFLSELRSYGVELQGVELTLMEPVEYTAAHPLSVKCASTAGGTGGAVAVAGPAAMQKTTYDAQALLNEMLWAKVRKSFIDEMRVAFNRTGPSVPNAPKNN